MEHQSKRKRIPQLDSVRVIAILMIAVSHINFIGQYSYGWVWSTFFNNPNFGVDYFFILSGVGLYMAYASQYAPCQSEPLNGSKKNGGGCVLQ